MVDGAVPAWHAYGGIKRIQAELRALMRAVQSGKTACPQLSELTTHGNSVNVWRFKLKNFDEDMVGGAQLNRDLLALWRHYGCDALEMEVRFPEDYPTRPFMLRVVKPRCMWYTGHVTAGGSVCCEALVLTGSPAGWQPSFCVETVLLEVISNMVDCEQVMVRTQSGGGVSGPLRIDLNHQYCQHVMQEYSLHDAESAFHRTLATYGWSNNRVTPAAHRALPQPKPAPKPAPPKPAPPKPAAPKPAPPKPAPAAAQYPPPRAAAAAAAASRLASAAAAGRASASAAGQRSSPSAAGAVPQKRKAQQQQQQPAAARQGQSPASAQQGQPSAKRAKPSPAAVKKPEVISLLDDDSSDDCILVSSRSGHKPAPAAAAAPAPTRAAPAPARAAPTPARAVPTPARAAPTPAGPAPTPARPAPSSARPAPGGARSEAAAAAAAAAAARAAQGASLEGAAAAVRAAQDRKWKAAQEEKQRAAEDAERRDAQLAAAIAEQEHKAAEEERRRAEHEAQRRAAQEEQRRAAEEKKWKAAQEEKRRAAEHEEQKRKNQQLEEENKRLKREKEELEKREAQASSGLEEPPPHWTITRHTRTGALEFIELPLPRKGKRHHHRQQDAYNDNEDDIRDLMANGMSRSESIKALRDAGGSVRRALLSYVSKMEAEDDGDASGSGIPNWDPELHSMLRQNGLDEEAAQAVLSVAQGDWEGVLQLLPEVTKPGGLDALRRRARQGAAQPSSGRTAAQAAAKAAADAKAAQEAEEALRQQILEQEAEEVLSMFVCVNARHAHRGGNSCPGCGPVGRDQVCRIERIQNLELWTDYQKRMKKVEREAGRYGATEKLLWHGSSQDTIAVIAHEGFDARVSNLGGAMGAGVYFAESSSYSRDFSVHGGVRAAVAPGSLGGWLGGGINFGPGVFVNGLPAFQQQPGGAAVPRGVARPRFVQGGYAMLLCKVALGRYTPGGPGMRKPPAGCQSVSGPGADNTSNYAVFHNDQAYPAYIVHWTE